jgi:hypothetical protein
MSDLFQLEIALRGDAFTPEPGPELARLLREVAEKLDSEAVVSAGLVQDLNGNRCGTWWVESEERVNA